MSVGNFLQAEHAADWPGFFEENSMTLATDQNFHGHPISATGLQFIAIRDAVMDRWEREVRQRVEGARTLLR